MSGAHLTGNLSPAKDLPSHIVEKELTWRLLLSELREVQQPSRVQGPSLEAEGQAEVPESCVGRAHFPIKHMEMSPFRSG